MARAGSIIAEINVAVSRLEEDVLENKLLLICAVHHLINTRGSYGDHVPGRQTVCQEF